MAKQESSALTDAASAFDAELATYTRLGELFIRTPLSSVKHLERANSTLADIAACEERLQTAGQRLVQALSQARGQQEELAKQVVAHVPTLQERNKRLQELMTELASVAGEVAGLNQLIAHRGGNGDSTIGPTAQDARDVSATVLALSDRAEQLASTAREAEFEELATQAHALHQKLQAIGKKLAMVGGSPS
ncbi:MAG TPA: hypothetical protein VFQ53_38300 [Kofleriaceae bacterium]|nr:hypothetical protein [Kofleriaceae bacterium]